MRVNAAQYYYLFDNSYGAGDLTLADGSKLPIVAAQVICFPVGGFFDTTFHSGSFVGSRSGYYNLNNVDHFKMDGSVIATQSVERLSYPDTVCGPTYSLSGHLYQKKLILPGNDHEFSHMVFGRSGSTPAANWFYSAGSFWESPLCVACLLGYPDSSNPTSGTGVYQINLFETTGFTVVSGKFSFSTREVRKVLPYRTSQYSPRECWQLVRDDLLCELRALSFKARKPGPVSALLPGYNPESMPNFNMPPDPHSVFPNVIVPWEDLAREAYSTVGFFSGNGIAFVKDLATMKQQATSTLALIKSLASREGNLAIIAKLFLAFHYGWKLFASDCQSLHLAYKRFTSLTSGKCKCSSHREWSELGIRYSAYYHCYYTMYDQLDTILYRLSSAFDFNLTLGNIWDLVPLSFVIDWFVNVSSMLESLDSYYSLTQEHKVICTGRSIKCTRTTKSFTGFAGCLTYVWYRRKYTGQIIYPTLSLGPTSNPLNHSIEGTALIVSRR